MSGLMDPTSYSDDSWSNRPSDGYGRSPASSTSTKASTTDAPAKAGSGGYAGPALMAFGGAMEGFGAIEEAKDRARMLENAAQYSMMNAAVAKQNAQYNAEKQDIQSQKIFGSIRAGYGASGIAADSGSALAVLQQSHVNAELDRLQILHAGDMEAYNLTNRANDARRGAKSAMRAGQINAYAAIFKTAATVAMLA